MTLGEKIKKLRIQTGLSQEQLANMLNTTKQAIYKYENGIVTNIPLDKIELLSSILGTTPSYLMGWEEDKTAPTEPKLSEGEEMLLKLFRKLPQEAQNSYIERLEEALKTLGLI